jgi:2-dehydro-3-deoxyphosphogluconate aldolase / (4S)-4-hydroxy-2-oxoglutarate aldolase
VPPLCEALLSGGVHAIELTMTIPDALAAIRQAVAQFGQRALIGVGTILSGEMANAAIAAGAEFVVSPITRPDIVAASHAADRPVMMGAYTPTEAQVAYEMGSDFIKLFPADGLGANYVKALRGPLPHLKMVPTGGVDLTTAASFFEAGCAAVGVGSSLLSSKAIQSAQWAEITRLAGEFVKIARACGR